MKTRHAISKRRRTFHAHAGKMKYLPLGKLTVIFVIICLFLTLSYWKMNQINKQNLSQHIFPINTKAIAVLDGNTIILQNGWTMGLLGININNIDKNSNEKARHFLESMVVNKNLTVEYYDIYQRDKFGRILAYVWIDCMPNLKEYCLGDKILLNKLMMTNDWASKDVSANLSLRYDVLLN